MTTYQSFRIISVQCAPDRLRRTTFYLAATLLWVHHHPGVGRLQGMKDPNLTGGGVDGDPEGVNVERRGTWTTAVVSVRCQRTSVCGCDPWQVDELRSGLDSLWAESARPLVDTEGSGGHIEDRLT